MSGIFDMRGEVRRPKWPFQIARALCVPLEVFSYADDTPALNHGEERMSSYRTIAAAVGVLFLLSYTGFSIGTALVLPSLDPSTDLATLIAEEPRLIAGALGLFVNMAAIIGIAALLFPVMRPHGEGVALWYIGFRIIEAGAFVIGTVSVLSLISVSEASIAAAAPSAPVYEGLRSLALAGNWWAGKMATVAFIFGAVGLYALLYRSRLVPRFIAAWGLVSVALLIVANLLAVDVTAGFQPLALLYAPIALNELFLAIWLIVKGFDGSAVDRPVQPSPLATPAQP